MATQTAKKQLVKGKMSATTAKTGKPSPSSYAFAEVFTALRGILSPYEGRLITRGTDPGYYYLESLEPTYKDRPMFFAAVRAGKNYVSYHLMPVYASPELNQKLSPELKKRMQGKACFNFTVVDAPLFKELAEVTKAGYKIFKERGWL